MEHPYSIIWDREPVACFRISGELDRELAEGGTVGPPRRAESSQPDHSAVPGNDLVTSEEPLARLDRRFLPLVFDADPRPFHGVMPYRDGAMLSWRYSR